MENNKQDDNKIIDAKIEKNNDFFVSKWTIFLKIGTIVFTLFVIYEFMIYLFLDKLEIMGIIFFGLPILPFILISSIFNLNDYIMWFLAGFGYFLLGGFLGLIIYNLKLKFRK